jgi:hypothetical protein
MRREEENAAESAVLGFPQVEHLFKTESFLVGGVVSKLLAGVR